MSALDNQESRYDHVRRLVDGRLSGSTTPINDLEFDNREEIRYGEKSMGNLFEFLQKIIRRDSLPSTRDRLTELLAEELNLTSEQQKNFFGGITRQQRELLIRTITEFDIPLAEQTFSEEFRAPTERSAKEGLLSMLPGTFLKSGARSFDSIILPKRKVNLRLSIDSIPESKDYNIEFNISVEPTEDISWLQDVLFRIIDEDGKILARDQKFDESGKLAVRLQNIADYSDHARFLLTTEG